jgi:tripartite-type tricarboxylate transporter receptor subunit TctC
MKLRHFALTFGLLTAVLSGAMPSAVAQTAYPTRPIRLIVPYPPGGGADAVARVVSQSLSERINAAVVVENRPGAATNLGMDATARAAPDGYTFGLATSNLAINPPLYPNMPYKPKQDLTPVSLLSKGLYVLVVNPSVPAKSVKELIALAKAKPGTLNAAIAGFGTPGHLALAQFNLLAGVDIASIPYQGAAPAINAILGDTAQVLFISMASALPYVKAGSLRMLAITSREHSPDLPDVPNAREAGLPGDDIFEWYGVVAPARTDPKQIDYLSGEIRKVLADPSIQQKIKLLGAEAAPTTPDEFSSFIDSQTTSLGEIVRRTGLKAQ